MIYYFSEHNKNDTTLKQIVNLKTRAKVSHKIADYVLEILQLLLYKLAFQKMTNKHPNITLLVIGKDKDNSVFYKVFDSKSKEVTKYYQLLKSIITFHVKKKEVSYKIICE